MFMTYVFIYSIYYIYMPELTTTHKHSRDKIYTHRPAHSHDATVHTQVQMPDVHCSFTHMLSKPSTCSCIHSHKHNGTQVQKPTPHLCTSPAHPHRCVVCACKTPPTHTHTRTHTMNTTHMHDCTPMRTYSALCDHAHYKLNMQHGIGCKL